MTEKWKSKGMILFFAVAVVAVSTTYFLFRNRVGDNQDSLAEDQLAQCLTEKGVKMYGAFWCSHCAKQKEEFGKRAFEKITYIECSPNGDRRAFSQECKNADIASYPTWVFADGSRLTGEQALGLLAQKAECSYAQ